VHRTIDVALGLTPAMRALAVSTSALLADRMVEYAHPSAFRLGESFPGDEGGPACEPHVSLFMLAVTEPEIPGVLAAVREVAGRVPAIVAVGLEYRFNPHGAPELYFARSAGWVALQRAVVEAVEPLRRGRLRDRDPSGARLADLRRELRRDEPAGHRLRQLSRYGYDEIVDDECDRFNPHVTLAWPRDIFDVDLSGLPAPAQFSGVLTDLAVFGMGENGTCGTRYGGFALTGDVVLADEGHDAGRRTDPRLGFAS
jgi:hypothetical protein